MKKFSTTIAGLAALRSATGQGGEAGNDRLQELKSFGSNPGALAAKIHVPQTLADRPALVVVLHGCTQTAAAYDHGSGWSMLADRHGFALLFPEQRRTNNPNLCFNWFSPADNGRDRGEALSIRQMIAAMVEAHGIDPARIFITGLSAGGAMTSIMLASYPELFAGGAIIAGLPFGSAANVAEAMEAMRGQGSHRQRDWGEPVRRASAHEGPWPSISIWHGGADPTVHSSNADATLAQWLSVHGLDATPEATEMVAGYPRRVWKDAQDKILIEDYRITGLGHGTPLATREEGACGVPGPHMLEAGISSTAHIAAMWKLSVASVRREETPSKSAGEQDVAVPAIRMGRLERLSPIEQPSAKVGVEKVIEDALRAAGLMR